MQVIADASARLVWASPALPGSAHDLSAARTHGIIDALTNANVMTSPTRATKVPAAACALRSDGTDTGRSCHGGRRR
jgi:hypothetical protein